MGMRHHALFYALRFIRPYGTIVCFFPVSQEFLLGYGQTVPTKSRRDALRIAQDASPGISRRCRGSPVGTFETARSVPYASLIAFDPVPFYPWLKKHNGQIGLHGHAPSCFLLRDPFHTSLRDYRLVFPRVPGVPPGLRSNRPYGTIVWFFPVSQEFLLGYGQTVPTGLTYPSHDSMRGASSSVMHKVHRTKMSKLQGQAGQPVPHTRPNFCSC